MRENRFEFMGQFVLYNHRGIPGNTHALPRTGQLRQASQFHEGGGAYARILFIKGPSATLFIE
jgi:hypothetical protein